ncbi:AAA family ATPase [Solihabitans fulvus]|uniref:AAA family ATPase n=1 Tax=Solihabitans fulvus TaxID=1892852 RepID=A0A5B2X6H7_9PSEU|nr:AAA family ATPase [Solihabitans fulvus]KAA2258816.1 AAA family ATPase [Solihabitans fulvus]
MPRPERQLGPENDVLQRFAADLRRLRESAGSPGYRELARRANYSSTTLSDAAGGRRLPSLPVTLAYVGVCDGDRAEWEARWRAVAAELAPTELEAPDNDIRAPYVGLAAFQPEDADRFFGRRRLVDELVARLGQRRFLAVFGPSGSGKSSLLRAGLLPAVAAADSETDRARPVLLFTPGEHPLHECATQLARLLGVPAGSVLADLIADPHHLNLAVRQALLTLPEEAELLIVVDQFEEVFTQCGDSGERTQFVAALLAAAQATTSRARVVLGVRADFYGRCAEHPDLVEALQDGQTLVGGMQAEELRAAITQPAISAGLAVETALVSTIVSEMVGRPGALPLMSHALVETWRRRRGNTLTLAGYQAAGAIEGAVAQTAERTHTALDPARQQVAREVFLRLTTLGEGTDDLRRRARRAELDDIDPAAAEVLDTLARARLLTLGEETVEIAHEAVIRSWPRLRHWLTRDRDGLRVHRQLTEAANTWESLGRDPGALYRGVQLDTACEWNTRRRTSLTPAEQQFLDASSAARVGEHRATQRRARRLWSLVAGIAVVAMVAVVTSVVAVRQTQAAEDQRSLAMSRKLAADSVAMATVAPENSMLLAIEAYHQAPTVEARSALLSAQGQAFEARLTGHQQAVVSVAFNPDGHTLATASLDGTVKLWDSTTRRTTATFDATTTSGFTGRVLAFSPDGHTLATNSRDGAVALWDVTTQRQRSTIGDHVHVNTAATFSPDGRTVALGTVRGVVNLWDLVTGTETELSGGNGFVGDAAFSPDGRLLAAEDASGAVQLWEVGSHAATTLQAGHSAAGLGSGLAFSPDGRLLAVGGADGVRLWDPASRQEIPGLSDHSGTVLDLAFGPDGRTLVSLGRNVGLWDVQSRQEIRVLARNDDVAHGVAVSPDGHTVAAGGSGNAVTLWDLRGPVLTSHPVSADSPRDAAPVAFGPDGRTLAVGGHTGGVELWDLSSRTSTAIPVGDRAFVYGLTFGPDGRSLVVGSRSLVGRDGITHGQVDLWDVTSSRDVATYPAPYDSVGVMFDPDGHALVATGTVGLVGLTDVATREEIAVQTDEKGAVSGAALGLDGHTLAVSGAGQASNDGSVEVWNVQTRQRIATLAGHEGVIAGVALSPDGRTVAAGSQDGTVHLWDVAMQQETAVLTGHTGAVSALAFSADGHTLATSGHDGAVRLWDLDVNHVRDRLCRTVLDNTTAEQRGRLVPDGSLPQCGTR